MNKNKRMMFIKRKIRDLTVKMQPRILKSRANRCRSNDPPKEKTESIIHRFFSPTKVLSPLADKIERHLPTIQRKNYVQMQLQNKTRKNQNILNKINCIENISKNEVLLKRIKNRDRSNITCVQTPSELPTGENNGVANNMPKGMVDFISIQNKRNNNRYQSNSKCIERNEEYDDLFTIKFDSPEDPNREDSHKEKVLHKNDHTCFQTWINEEEETEKIDISHFKHVNIDSSIKSNDSQSDWKGISDSQKRKREKEHLSRVRKLKEIISDNELTQIRDDIWLTMSHTISV